mmetsp:Transcript_133645/g.249999  ORF Transcript_133645/g.249999 Transcript_133645/m.249999 type:complete len:102 (+) Transcript_133645:70-375(+)
MAAKPQVEITSCALGGHLLGRGSAVQKEIQDQMPQADVKHSYGCPLQFSIAVDGEPVLGGFSGSCTILKLLMCCAYARDVAKSAVGDKPGEAPAEDTAMGA